MKTPGAAELEKAGLTASQALVIADLVNTEVFNAEQRGLRWSVMISLGVAWLVILAVWVGR